MGFLGKHYFFVKLIFLTCISFPLLFASSYDYIFKHYNVSSYSNYSTLGLIQNPNARFHPAGTVGFTFSDMDPYYRGSIMAYPFEWFEAAYQYTDVNNALYSRNEAFSGKQTYKDKGFDVKFRVFKENEFFPQVAIGLRDVAGSGTFSAEYVVASKMLFTKNLIYDISLGMGWGGLSNQDFSNPLTKISDRFEERTEPDSDTQGGEFGTGRFFSGDVGIFGGAEIFLPNFRGLRFKIEYDGTDYFQEGFPTAESSRFAFEDVRKSQSRINYGLVFPVNRHLQLRTSFVKGNTLSIGFSLSGFFGPKEPLVKKRDKFKEIQNQEIIKEITSSDNLLFYRGALTELRKQGLFLQKAHIENDAFEVVYAQGKFRDNSRAIGRVARTLDAISPDYIKTFKIIDDNAGMFLNEATVRRDEFTKYADENIFSLGKRAIELNSLKASEREYYEYQPEGEYPAHFYKIAPVIRSQIGGPDGFYFGEVSIGYTSEIKFSKNIALITSGQIGLGSNFDSLKLKSDSVLPHVRSDIVLYLKESQDYNIRRMQLNIFNNPFRDFYTKFSAGILEDMFSGVGGEILYRPFNKNFAIGMDAWAVQQRDYNMLFDLQDYKTTTGHLNFYFQEPKSNILFTVRGGRFLAKDSGFTFDASRRFPSGLRMGAFFSLTDISRAEFGEGSFDKGFYFHIPMEIFSNIYSKGSASFGLKPLTRDGAAALAPAFNLFGVTYEGQSIFLDSSWSALYD